MKCRPVVLCAPLTRQCCLGPLTYLAIAIAQIWEGPRSGEICYKSLAVCLRKLASYAVEQHASVHLPRIGGSGESWYKSERAIQSILVAAGVPTYVYHFQRHHSSSPPRQRTGTSPPRPTARLPHHHDNDDANDADDANDTHQHDQTDDDDNNNDNDDDNNNDNNNNYVGVQGSAEPMATITVTPPTPSIVRGAPDRDLIETTSTICSASNDSLAQQEAHVLAQIRQPLPDVFDGLTILLWRIGYNLSASQSGSGSLPTSPDTSDAEALLDGRLLERHVIAFGGCITRAANSSTNVIVTSDHADATDTELRRLMAKCASNVCVITLDWLVASIQQRRRLSMIDYLAI
jgi:hypothetical protein